MKLFENLILALILAFVSAPAFAQEDPFGPLIPIEKPVTPVEKPTTQLAPNPFSEPLEPAKPQIDPYDGEFVSDDVRLSLARFGPRYLGELNYLSKGQIYAVEGTVNDDLFSGVFKSAGNRFAFTFTLDETANSGLFKTAVFESVLQNVNAPAPVAKPVLAPNLVSE